MTNRITETLDQYLMQGYELPSNINRFKTIVMYDQTLNFKDMFIQRNRFKEIGSESEEIFKQNLSSLIDESYLIYYNKIVNSLSIIDKAFKPLTLSKNVSVTLKDSGSNTVINSGNDTTVVDEDKIHSIDETGTQTNAKTGSIEKTYNLTNKNVKLGMESISEKNGGKDSQSGSGNNEKFNLLYPANSNSEKLTDKTKGVNNAEMEMNYGKTVATEKTFNNRTDTETKTGTESESFNELKETQSNNVDKTETVENDRTETVNYGKTEKTDFGKQQTRTESINLSDSHYLGNSKYIEMLQNIKMYLYEALAYLDKAFIGEY